MHVGYHIAFQNPDNAFADEDIYANELRLVDVAVDLGFESIWTVEHHFTDYIMSPDPLQLLTYFAARYPNVRLGTGVVVLPWHEPVRCVEQIALLDNLSDGRLILGLGRGIAAVEYEGFRADMNTSRQLFVDFTRFIVDGIESGVIEAANPFFTVPRRELRPRPRYSMTGRVYAGAMSPEAMPIMAKLGIGILVIPQKPWHTVKGDIDSFNDAWREHHSPAVPPPPPLTGGHTYVHHDRNVAREVAERYIGAYYYSVMKHYGFREHAHQGVKGYEFYASISRYIDRQGEDGAALDYVNLMPWGTPDQVIEKITALYELIGMAAINPWFSYAGMPPDVAEASLRLWAKEVLPEIQRIAAPALAPVTKREVR